MTYKMILSKPAPIIEPFDDSALKKEIELRDSIIEQWESSALYWQSISEIAMKKVDSLESLKPKVKHHYHEIYKDISDGTVVYLDSLIRSRW